MPIEEKYITGMFFRVKRDGLWLNLDIAQLTDEELDEVLEGRTAKWCRKGMKMLAIWIRDNVIIN